jgi:hypothetical protein
MQVESFYGIQNRVADRTATLPDSRIRIPNPNPEQKPNPNPEKESARGNTDPVLEHSLNHSTNGHGTSNDHDASKGTTKPAERNPTTTENDRTLRVIRQYARATYASQGNQYIDNVITSLDRRWTKDCREGRVDPAADWVPPETVSA